MKMIGRILIILIAALVIVGATMAFAKTDAASQMGGGQKDGRFPTNGEVERNDLGDNLGEGGFQRGHNHEGGEGRGGFNIATQVKNLAVIGAIVLVVALISRLNLQKWRKRKSALS